GREALRAIELAGADRVLIADALGDQRAVLLEIGFAATGADPRVIAHPPHQGLEVPGRQDKVEVELAEIAVLADVDRLQPRVERLDDAGADGAVAAIRAGHDGNPVVLRRIFSQDAGRLIGRAVIDDDPSRGPRALRNDTVERLAHEPRFVTAGGDDCVASRL